MSHEMHLGDPFRRDETRRFDRGEATRGQRVDETDLVVGRDDRLNREDNKGQGIAPPSRSAGHL